MEIQNYVKILLDQEQIKPLSLKDKWIRITDSLLKNAGKSLQFDVQKPDFKDLIN